MVLLATATLAAGLLLAGETDEVSKHSVDLAGFSLLKRNHGLSVQDGLEGEACFRHLTVSLLLYFYRHSIVLTDIKPA